MMVIRRIFTRQSRRASAARSVTAPVVAHESLIRAALHAWPQYAGPFFTCDGQSAVACAALCQTPELHDAA